VSPALSDEGKEQLLTMSGLDFSDIKRARQLLDSVIKSNPKHAPGWIAAASLEGESSTRRLNVAHELIESLLDSGSPCEEDGRCAEDHRSGL
jgi:hypothetical protein